MDNQTSMAMMPIRSGRVRDYWLDILNSVKVLMSILNE